MSNLYVISLIVVMFIILAKIYEIMFIKRRELKIQISYGVGFIIFICSVYLAYYEKDFLTSVWIVMMYLLFEYLVNY